MRPMRYYVLFQQLVYYENMVELRSTVRFILNSAEIFETKSLHALELYYILHTYAQSYIKLLTLAKTELLYPKNAGA